MAETSQIQWTDATWNVAVGCTKVDADCKYCYMYRGSLNNTRYDPLEVRKTKTVFNLPLKYKETVSSVWHGRPLIFTSSLTDFFHPDIDGFRDEAWDIIRKCPHLIFQILTKRPERIKECLPADWGEGYDNVWLGTSIGSQESISRMHNMIGFEAKVKFLSLEPLHGAIDLGAPKYKGFFVLPMFDWVIVGGESGNETGKYRYRPAETQWFRDIVDRCKLESIPVFVKQLGTHLAKEFMLKDRHGGDISEFPADLRVREFPKHCK